MKKILFVILIGFLLIIAIFIFVEIFSFYFSDADKKIEQTEFLNDKFQNSKKNK